MARKKRVVQVVWPQDSLVCNYSIFALQRLLGIAGLTSIPAHRFRLTTRLAWLVTKLRLLRGLVRLPGLAIFVQAHRLSEIYLFPLAYFFEPIIYAWDVWPYRYDQWEAFFRRHRVRLAFISAKQSAEEMQRRLPKMKVIWLPEATEPGHYLPDKPLALRSIDVLELGRRYTHYHAQILHPLQHAGKNHQYEKARWQGLFPTQRDLAEGYGNTKISICFPASVSHPEWARDCETVTLRFFESMASGCLIVGHAPAELTEIFGYNPIIEADHNDPGGQLLDILSKIETYQPLVEKNYKRLLEVGTWESRARTIANTLVEQGYRF